MVVFRVSVRQGITGNRRRMREGKDDRLGFHRMKLVSPHGVGGILTKADVGDQVRIGDDGQSVFSPTVKHPLIVPRINLVLINLLKDIRPIANER